MVEIDSPKLRHRFWSKVQPSTDDKCWPWMNDTVGGLKYGRFSVRDGEKVVGFRCNRLAFYYANGFWPVFACHKCDNAICCNPAHIFDGTPLENMQDMHRKGRQKPPNGERHWNSKLGELEVLEIRRRYSNGETQSKIATSFGCSRPMVSMIVTRKSWSHI